MKIVLAVAILLAMLVITAGVSFYIWDQLGDVEISMHGYIALALGAVLSLALGGGLMFLVFYSSRHGHDDDIGR